MCGIIGYVGKKNASRMVVEGLKNLEYRGYDSVGMSYSLKDSLLTKKGVGRVSEVNEQLHFSEPRSRTAIGHTRWATHGKVNTKNAHPHLDCNSYVAVVHNGIIENYQELKNYLIAKGHSFKSDTDTEVISHLVEIELSKSSDVETAVMHAVSKLEGTFAVLIAIKGENKIIAVKYKSPLVIGVAPGGYFAASDIPAFLKHTDKVIYLYDNDMVVLSDKLKFFNIKHSKLEPVKRPIEVIDWKHRTVNRGGFDHYMIKEILEQTETIRNVIKQDQRHLESVRNKIKKSNDIMLIASGSSYNAGLAARYIFSELTGKILNVVLASEVSNFTNLLSKKTLVIAISQSGETYDVLEAVRLAKERKCEVVSLVNTMGSTLIRESNVFLPIKTGPEISVLATKTYTSQVALLTLLAYTLDNRQEEGLKSLKYLRNVVYFLTSATQRQILLKLAYKLKKSTNIICIGRGLGYATALESALKIKEVSYIHAEAFASGELKHGPIALIEKNTPCIIFASGSNYKASLSNAIEVKSRGGYIIGVSPQNNEIFDFWIKVPECGLGNPIVQIIPIQLLAYQLAVSKGYNPDRPRHLAKSVTVK